MLVISLRMEVVHDLTGLVEDWSEHTQTCYCNIPAHVSAVYRADGGLLQVPLLLHLLRICHFPGVGQLRQDLSIGFEVLGPMPSGPGWLPRTDDKYTKNLDDATFASANLQHTRSRVHQPGHDSHWQTMLDELLVEKTKGRLAGPFAAPTAWNVTMLSVPGHDLQPLGSQDIRAAFSLLSSQTKSDALRTGPHPFIMLPFFQGTSPRTTMLQFWSHAFNGQHRLTSGA